MNKNLLKTIQNLKLFILSIIALVIFSSCVFSQPDQPDLLVQNSTIDALLDGVYDGNTTFYDLAKYGNFGIGTFNGLDGEMLALNGKFYQLKSNGVAYRVDTSEKTPFAVVTFFKPEIKQKLKKGLTYKEFKKRQLKYIDSPNVFYAIQIEGKFKSLRVRSIPKQIKPYAELKDVVKQQKVYDFKHVNGTIVGFYCPSYTKGINVPGFHFHFINEAKTAGGHVLDFVIDDVVMQIDEKNDFFLSLPLSNAFRKSNLKKDRSNELHAVEQ